MSCDSCEKDRNCYRITLDSGETQLFVKKATSPLTKSWFDFKGSAITDEALIVELDEKATPENEVDCALAEPCCEENNIIPDLYPPFAVLENSCSGRYIVGTTFDVSECLTTRFDRGKIQLAGEMQDYRSGESTSASLYINGDYFNTNIPENVLLGTTCFTYRVNYAEGPQPKDFYGNDYDLPLVAGYVDSNTSCIKGYAPFYATVTDCLTYDEIDFEENQGEIDFTLAKEQPGKQSFLIPETHMLRGLFVYNDYTNQYEKTHFDLYDITSIYREFNGVSVKYYKFVFNGYTRGEVRMRLDVVEL